MLEIVEPLPFAVGRSPSRNCPLDPTTKMQFLRRDAGEARRAPPPTLRL